jgi:hypothetical protein
MRRTLKRRKLLAGLTGGGILTAWRGLVGAQTPSPTQIPSSRRPGAGAAPSPASEALLQPAVDLRSEAQQAAAAGWPLVLLFSRADCPYCQRVRQDYLLPLLQDARFAGLVIRQIDIDRPRVLRDFAGQTTRHAAFAAQLGIRWVPVVGFYAPDGRPTAEPLVGALLPDFYLAHLENALRRGAHPAAP